jgi:hypothetical protein
MAGSRSGSITEWDDPPGQGLITEDGDGVHVVLASENPGLDVAMRGKTPPVPVSFDLDLRNHAINVTVQMLALAASAAPVAKDLTRSLAVPRPSAAPAKKKAAPAKKSTMTTSSKKTQSKPQPKSTAPKKRRP